MLAICNGTTHLTQRGTAANGRCGPRLDNRSGLRLSVWLHWKWLSAGMAADKVDDALSQQDADGEQRRRSLQEPEAFSVAQPGGVHHRRGLREASEQHARAGAFPAKLRSETPARADEPRPVDAGLQRGLADRGVLARVRAGTTGRRLPAV